MNSYFLYRNDRRAQLKIEQPTMGGTEVLKLIAEEWQVIDPELKEKYEKQYQQDKLQYAHDKQAIEEGRMVAPVRATTTAGTKKVVANVVSNHNAETAEE